MSTRRRNPIGFFRRNNRTRPVMGRSRKGVRDTYEHAGETWKMKIKPMSLSQAERAAEKLGAEWKKPAKLIAIRERPDGKYDTFMQSFNNERAAERAKEYLQSKGYNVGLASIHRDQKGNVIDARMDLHNGGP